MSAPSANRQSLGCVKEILDDGVPDASAVVLGEGVAVHRARIGDNCIVGIRAVLFNGSEVGENSIVGACALLTEGKRYPPNSPILGIPAKAKRELTLEEIEANRDSAARYVQRVQAFKEGRFG